jgi:hypothetical protein
LRVKRLQVGVSTIRPSAVFPFDGPRNGPACIEFNREVVKWVGTGRFGLLVFALNAVDMNPKNLVPSLQAVKKFVPDPPPCPRVGPDKNNRDRGVFKFSINQVLECRRTGPLGLLPNRIVVVSQAPLRLRRSYAFEQRSPESRSRLGSEKQSRRVWPCSCLLELVNKVHDNGLEFVRGSRCVIKLVEYLSKVGVGIGEIFWKVVADELPKFLCHKSGSSDG